MPSAFLLCFLIFFPCYFRLSFVSLLLSCNFYFVHIVFYSSWQTKLLPRPALLSLTSLSEYFADVRFCSSFCCCCSIHIMQVQQIWFSFFLILCALVSFFLLPFFVSCFSAEFSAPFLVIQLGFFCSSCVSPFLLLLMCGKGIPSQGRVGQVELAEIATLTRLVSSRSYRSKYMKQVHSIRFINETVAPSDDESF